MEESIVFSHQVSNDTRSITFAHFISPYKMCHYKDFWPTQQLIVAGAGMPQSKKGNIPNSTRAAFIYSDNWDDHSWIYQLHHWAISNQLPSTKNVRTSSDLNASSNFSKLRKRGGGERKKERKEERKKKEERNDWRKYSNDFRNRNGNSFQLGLGYIKWLLPSRDRWLVNTFEQCSYL